MPCIWKSSTVQTKTFILNNRKFSFLLFTKQNVILTWKGPVLIKLHQMNKIYIFNILISMKNAYSKILPSQIMKYNSSLTAVAKCCHKFRGLHPSDKNLIEEIMVSSLSLLVRNLLKAKLTLQLWVIFQCYKFITFACNIFFFFQVNPHCVQRKLTLTIVC